MKSFLRFSLFAAILSLTMCKPDDDTPPAQPEVPEVAGSVNFSAEEVPYALLSEYAFFKEDLKALEPAEGVLPYDLITPLFSDYAKKKRFVWMAEGSSAEYNADHLSLDFDNGTVLIKNFFYDHILPSGEPRIIETRLMYKLDGEWQFAEYVWNEEQTEAHLDLSGSYLDISWLQNGTEEMSTTYRIPAEGECFTCHKTGTTAMPLGPKPQNIDRTYAYKDGVKNQLQKWAETGYLRGDFPSEINRIAAWDDPDVLLSDRLRSYLDVNCSSCHLEGSHCDYRPIRLAWNETAEPENLGVCVEPDEWINTALIRIISPGSTERSVMHYRMSTTEGSLRMPLLGRTVVHQEGLELLTAYIESLNEPCE